MAYRKIISSHIEGVGMGIVFVFCAGLGFITGAFTTTWPVENWIVRGLIWVGFSIVIMMMSSLIALAIVRWDYAIFRVLLGWALRFV